MMLGTMNRCSFHCHSNSKNRTITWARKVAECYLTNAFLNEILDTLNISSRSYTTQQLRGCAFMEECGEEPNHYKVQVRIQTLCPCYLQKVDNLWSLKVQPETSAGFQRNLLAKNFCKRSELRWLGAGCADHCLQSLPVGMSVRIRAAIVRWRGFFSVCSLSRKWLRQAERWISRSEFGQTGVWEAVQRAQAHRQQPTPRLLPAPLCVCVCLRQREQAGGVGGEGGWLVDVLRACTCPGTPTRY